jgi:hypothetical protein
MNNDTCYEKYPLWMVLVSSLFSVLLYASGAFVMFQAGLVWMILYILYFLCLEVVLLRRSCVNCFYYGKICAFGRGRICGLFFKSGNPQDFAKRDVTWKSMLPDLLVSVIPIVTAIVLMIIDFSWVLVALLMIILLVTSAGNGFVRGSLACRYCRQGKIGCPALRLFDRKKAA